jgi:hypothetical protein
VATRWCASVVRVTRSRSDTVYRSSLFGDADRRQVPLTTSDWGRLQDSFWALDPDEGSIIRSLDGAFWTIEERRKNIYRAVHRWSPDGAIYDLGNLFFELAGPPLAEVSLY